ncbi:MAG TPA: transcription elongation factor GreA [Acidimicrobiia bacterium]|nr:transcription elongation factor GreA [Acidimicrobiia bacterium]
MAPSHFSPDAHQRLSEEHAHRSGPYRREISLRIERAREHGDIRENADYDAAKNEQGLNEARVRQIAALLDDAVIVEPGTDSGGVVAAGSLVEITMDGDDEPLVYLVGSIEERHDTYEVLSTSGPLGQAVLGHTPGETLTYETPRGAEVTVKIVAVRPLD